MYLILILCPAVLAGHLNTMYSWTAVDFNFPSDAVRNSYVSSGKFVPKNIIVLDVDVWQGAKGDKKVFVTLPNFKTGSPVTLATVTNIRRNNTTLLQPYPDWSWHQGKCDGLISVFRTHVDKCGRLWVLDTGFVDVFNTAKRICSPQILVFDLIKNTLIKRYRIPDSVLNKNSLVLTIAVDTRAKDCSDAFAYLADCNGHKLIVYDFAHDKSWAIANKYFGPDLQHESFTIAGKQFKLQDGLFGLALSPLLPSGDRTLYFHSLVSVKESWVSTSVIRNSSLFANNPGAALDSFHVSEGSRSSQSAPEDMTDNGVLIYGLMGDNAIGCWNSKLPFKNENLNIIAKDDVALQFQSGLKVYGNDVWTLSCRFQNYILNQVPDNEINYRINNGKISDLIQNTKCDPKSSG